MLKKMLKSVLPIALVIAMLFSHSALAATVGLYQLNDDNETANMESAITSGVKATDTFAVVVEGAQSNEMVTILIYEDVDAEGEEGHDVFNEDEEILYIWQINADGAGKATFKVSLPEGVGTGAKAVAIGSESNTNADYFAEGEFNVVPDVVTYTITWKNGEETLKTDTVEEGDMPEYTGETPVKAATPEYTYTFAGWDPEVVVAAADATYTAKFNETKNKYKVTWVVGETSTTAEVEYGTVPVFEGTTDKAKDAQYTYTFAGWDVEPVAVTGDVTYTATYTQTVNSYTVKFLNDDDSVIEEKAYKYGETPVAPTATKVADAQYTYTFKAWDKEVVAVEGDATYKATYTATKNKYTITFVDEDETTVLYETEVEYGTVPTYVGNEPTKASTEQYNYTFAGWNNKLVAVEGDATYVAKYSSTVRQYTIKFVNYDDAEIATYTLDYGTQITAPETIPTKEATAEFNYEFKGWGELPTVSGDVTYRADFNAIKRSYTITWVVDGSTDTTTVEYGVVPTHADPTKAADAQYTYTFSKWSPDVVAVTGEAEYIAEFTSTLNKYTVTWVVDGKETTAEVEYGTIPTAPNTDKAADAQYTYKFTGWDKEVVAVTGDVTYTAQYEKTVNKYTVTFVVEGDTVQSGEVAYGETPVYSGETPTKVATVDKTYTFAGWTPAIEEVTGDATYTATFTEAAREYTITWKNDDGSVIDTTTVAYGVVPTHADATKAEDDEFTYTFKEWTPAITTVTGDATYTAVFGAVEKEQSYTADFGDYADDITMKKSQGFTFELPAPTNIGSKQFVGWKSGDIFLPAGETVTFTDSDLTFEAVFAEIDILETAAIRLNVEQPGIRFTASSNAIDGAEYGTLLALYAALDSRDLENKYTLKDIQDFNGNLPEGKTALKCANVKAQHFYDGADKQTTADKEFRTVMIVPQTRDNAGMYGLDWAARSYVTVKYSNDETATFYSNTIALRSPQTVAAAAKADTDKYNSYKQEEKDIIDIYAANEEAPAEQ